jgi:hypothetical protein
MKLPLVNEAEVPRAKIVLYLVDPNHRSGKSKARFFAGHGYAAERWQELAEALRTHASENEVVKQETTPLGVRLVVEGPLTCETARLPRFGRYGLLSPANGRPAWQRPTPCDNESEHDQRTG